MPFVGYRVVNVGLWMCLGLVVAVFGNWVGLIVVTHYPHLAGWNLVRHADELFVGLSFGIARWVHGEWALLVQNQYMSREAERELDDSLMVLRYGTDDVKRRAAMKIVMDRLASQKVVHADFRGPEDKHRKVLKEKK